MQEVATGFGRVEAPFWINGEGLYFSDVLNGGVHLLDHRGQVSLAVPKRAVSAAWRGKGPAAS